MTDVTFRNVLPWRVEMLVTLAWLIGEGRGEDWDIEKETALGSDAVLFLLDSMRDLWTNEKEYQETYWAMHKEESRNSPWTKKCEVMLMRLEEFRESLTALQGG